MEIKEIIIPIREGGHGSEAEVFIQCAMYSPA